MATRRPGTTVPVLGPGGKRVDVKFFDDGSIGFTLKKACPMVLVYAFLSGKGYDLFIELRPTPESPWAPP